MNLAQPTESRAAMIQRWEREGRLDPNCPGCREFYESPLLPVDDGRRATKLPAAANRASGRIAAVPIVGIRGKP
jgi:hypothetical protein